MGTQKNCLNKRITLSIKIDMLKLKDSKIFTIFCLKLYNLERFLKLLPMVMLCFGE